METALDRAHRALEVAGMDSSLEMRRVESMANEVWILAEHVLRIGISHKLNIEAETKLLSQLPKEVKSPKLIKYGSDKQMAWMLLEKIEGEKLINVWPHLSDPEQIHVIGELAEILKSLHGTTAEMENNPDRAHLRSIKLDDLRIAIRQLKQNPVFDSGLIRETENFIENSEKIVAAAVPHGLIHGDLHFENVLWNKGQVSALLDFEYATTGPIDLELDMILRFCAYPYLFVPDGMEDKAKPEAYQEMPQLLRGKYPEMFKFPQGFERAMFYSIAFEVCALVKNPPSTIEGLPDWHPYNRLQCSMEGKGYLESFKSLFS